MLRTMSLGMSTAMITTALGIMFGNLLKLQFFMLTRET
jgi:flagellar motor component MotA